MNPQKTKVLCCAQGGQPVVRSFVSELQGAFEVMNPASGECGLFPAIDVFEFDSDLVFLLESSYDRGENEPLRELWARAKRFRCP